jgi:hypothetical protein
MAIVQNPLTGRSKQKFANAVFSTWKGKNVVKSKPLSVGNPRTELQTKQRSRFTTAVNATRGVTDFIRKAFKESAIGMTEFNVFVKKNIQNIDLSVLGNCVIDPNAVIVSAGSLTGLAGASISMLGSNEVDVFWSDNSNGSTIYGTDMVHLIAVDNATYELSVATESFARSLAFGGFHFDIPVSPGTHKFYVVVLRPTEGKSSNSQYLIL